MDVLFEGLVGERGDCFGALGDGFGIDPDFVLGVGVASEPDEMEEVVQIHLPIPFSVKRQGKIGPCYFTRQAFINHAKIVLVELALVCLKLGKHLVGLGDQFVAASLLVVRALIPHLAGFWHIEVILHDGVAAGYLVQPCRSVAHPLSGHKDRHFAVEGQDHLLEGAGVLMPQQVVNQGSILSEALGAATVADPGGLDDSLVAPHVVHQADEAFVEKGNLLVNQRFGFGDEDAGHASILAPDRLSQLRHNAEVAHRTKIILGALVLLAAACGFGGWFIFTQAKNTIFALNDEVSFEGDELMERLGRTWSDEDLMYYASADFLVMTEEPEREAWLKKMKEKLGAFKSGKGMVQGTVAVVKDLGGEDAFGAVYDNKAEFEKAKVTVRIQFIKRIRTGGWQMASLVVLNEKGEPDPAYAPDSAQQSGGSQS